MGLYDFIRHRREMMRAAGCVLRRRSDRETLTWQGWLNFALFMLFALVIAAALFLLVYPLVYFER